jgi:ribosome-associated toxin RatA of RatAB toxin-antitoxin module
MRNVRRSALVAIAPEQMFDIINEVERYPEFVSGCTGAHVLSRTPQEIVARLSIGRGPVTTSFTTRNRLEPCSRITMELVEGPFSELTGVWTLAPVLAPVTGSVMGCRVELDLSFRISGAIANLTVGPLIERTAGALVDAFIQRARERSLAQG